jgi:hypothetical protein
MRNLLVLALIFFAPSIASAQPADGLYRATYRSSASRRSVEVPFGSMTTHVVLGRILRARTARLTSVSNANDAYSLRVDTRGPRCGDIALRAGGTIVAAGSRTTDRAHCTVWFDLDRALADRAAAALGTPRLDRTAVGDRLQGRFVSTRASYARGEAIEIRLVLMNPAGGPPVQRQVGGRNRGPRDNQFDFRVFRNGVEIPRIEAFDFGGVTGFHTLAPGATAEASERLDRWADVSAPGRYRIECSWETDLAPDGLDAFALENRHRVWQRRFTGVVELEVRP